MSYNSKYFERKPDSLEEAILNAVNGVIKEKVEYVEYKFKNKNDAMKAKKMLDAIQLMGFEINDDNIRNGEISVDAGNKDMTKYHKEVMSKFRPKVMSTEAKLDEANHHLIFFFILIHLMTQKSLMTMLKKINKN